MPLYLTRTQPVSRVLARGVVALSLLSAVGSGCDEASSEPKTEADGGSKMADGGERDASLGGRDAGFDARAEPTPDGGQPDGGSPADSGAEAGIPSAPLDPWRLDCAKLATNTTCQGGPHEVMLVMEESGLIAMFEASNGKFLGYFKRSAADFQRGFNFVTQGPDQCIWTVGDESGVQRWDTDGSYLDRPLKPKFFPVPGASDDPAIQDPRSLAFTKDHVYVASTSGTPQARVTRWKLDGTFDATVLEDGTEPQSLLVLGDGSLVVVQESAEANRIIRIPETGGDPSVIFAESKGDDRHTIGQVSYASDNDVLLVESDLTGSAFRVSIETMIAKQVHPFTDSSANMSGIALLGNGKWLITGRTYQVSVLDPESENPTGQFKTVFKDQAPPYTAFRQVGRACLSEEFLASRASKPANNTCITPPVGAAIFEADFESPNDTLASSGFSDMNTADVTVEVGAALGNGSSGLRITGSNGLGPNAAYVRLPKGSQPTYVAYDVKIAENVAVSEGIFRLSNEKADEDTYTSLAGTYFRNDYLWAIDSYAAAEDPLPDQWVHVELRNMDWTTRTYDLYVDCKRIGEAIAMPAQGGDSMDRLDLYNYWESDESDLTAIAAYDNIVIK